MGVKGMGVKQRLGVLLHQTEKDYGDISS